MKGTSLTGALGAILMILPVIVLVVTIFGLHLPPIIPVTLLGSRIDLGWFILGGLVFICGLVLEIAAVYATTFGKTAFWEVF